MADRFLSTYFQRSYMKKIRCRSCGVTGRMQPVKTADGARIFCKSCCAIQRFSTRRKLWKWNEVGPELRSERPERSGKAKSWKMKSQDWKEASV